MKKLALALFVLIFSSAVFAETVSEKNFSELGFEEFTAEQANTEACRELEFFLSPQDLGEGNYAIVSLHAEFLPIAAGKAAVSLELGEFKQVLERKDFANGYARIFLPKDQLAESNKFILCGKTFDTITKIKFLKDSKVGSYKTLDFSKEDSFTVKILGQAFKNEPLKVEITVKNYGSLSGGIKIKHWAWTMPAVELVSTDTEFLARIPEFNYQTLAPGQKTFNYTIFPKASIAMSLPPAVLEYDNIFGEKQSMLSNQESFTVQSTEKELIAEIVSTNEINETNVPVQIKVIVRNPSTIEFNDYHVDPYEVKDKIVSGNADFVLINPQSNRISFKPGEEKTFLFDAIAYKEGSYEVGCRIYTTTQVSENFSIFDENSFVYCSTQKVFFEESKFDPTLLVIAILALVGLAVYFVLSRPQTETLSLGIAEIAPEEKKGPFGRKFTEPKKENK